MAFIKQKGKMVLQGNFSMSNLSIMSYNIHGLFSNVNGFRYSKLESPYFLDVIKDVLLFGLIETHHISN